MNTMHQYIPYAFKDHKLLNEALTHSSYKHENKLELDNERLEFIGDSLLNTMIALELFHRYPDLKEGELSRLRSALVNEATLSSLAKKMNLNQFIKVGKGEALKKELPNSILADAFEALLGAVFLDSSYETVRSFFQEIINLYENEFYHLDKLEEFDSKTKLQEMTLKNFNVLPIYEAQEIKLDNGMLGFAVKLLIKGEVIASMKAHSKKYAEKELSLIVLNKLKGEFYAS
jgi:ribonuclease-3